MNNKRRNHPNCFIFDDIKTDKDVNTNISTVCSKTTNTYYVYEKLKLKSEFGEGFISNFIFDEIQISISRYKLQNDLIINYSSNEKFIQLLFMLEGEKILTFSEDKADVLIESQDVYIANTNNFCGLSRVCCIKPFKEVCIKLPESFLLKHHICNERTFLKLLAKNNIQPITNDLFSVVTNIDSSRLNGISKKIFIEAKVLEILAILMENWSKESFFNYRPCMGVIKKVYLVERTIKQNLTYNYTVKEHANAVGLNEHILSLEFKRIFGESISVYSKKIKMEEAAKLLINTQCTIYEIAEYIGYKNATHFSAAFKKFYKKSPLQYRNKLK